MSQPTLTPKNGDFVRYLSEIENGQRRVIAPSEALKDSHSTPSPTPLSTKATEQTALKASQRKSKANPGVVFLLIGFALIGSSDYFEDPVPLLMFGGFFFLSGFMILNQKTKKKK